MADDPNQNEKELLGGDYVDVINKLSQQTTQMGGGFFQLAQETDFDDRYPNAINDFVQTEAVTSIAKEAGVDQNDLKSPFSISDEDITKIDQIVNVDPLNMSDDDLTALRASVEEIISGITIPTADELISFFDNYTKFVASASSENLSFPTNFREIELVSTDTSIDSFLARTGIRKLVAININKLVYPFITERFKIVSQKQGLVVGVTGLTGENVILYTDITKNIGVQQISATSRILITNNAKNIDDVLQQKVLIDWISEESQTIRLKSPLLFDLSSEFVVEIYQYTTDEVLSPGDIIKIPK